MTEEHDTQFRGLSLHSDYLLSGRGGVPGTHRELSEWPLI